MLTFKAEVVRREQKSDGTFNVETNDGKTLIYKYLC